MKKELKIGDSIVLLMDRGDSRKGDVLTVEKMDVSSFTTKEYWDISIREKHYIEIESYNIQFALVDEENCYEIY